MTHREGCKHQPSFFKQKLTFFALGDLHSTLQSQDSVPSAFLTNFPVKPTRGHTNCQGDKWHPLPGMRGSGTSIQVQIHVIAVNA